MASATDFLRARIAEISAAIHHQKEVLQNLINSKRDAQRELNSVVDPIARLPLEISSDILARCLPEFPRSHPDVAPMAFLHVSYAWNIIAHSTPSLWTAIQVTSPGSEGLPDGVDIWFARARALPLSLAVGDIGYEPTGKLVGKYAHRLQSLLLYFRSAGQHRRITTSQFTSLTTLTITRRQREGDRIGEDYSYWGTECVEMLNAAPNLSDCRLDRIFIYMWSHPPTQHTTHPCLRTLYLEQGSSRILHYLTLPCLQNLQLSYFDIGMGSFLGFLTRSSPPLQTFTILPTFSKLGLDGKELLDALAIRPPRDFLPNLHQLTVYCQSRREHKLLLSVLSARRQSGMGSVRLYLKSDDIGPGPDTIRSLRQLAADGLNIFVGKRGGENLI
ncbi:hypothetical protein B0H19DRAFT_1059813 [Mycena capillaripes]|nr:hypothetical protein B0H19DRAFT_1059813 [Mycena capillaripes]